MNGRRGSLVQELLVAGLIDDVTESIMLKRDINVVQAQPIKAGRFGGEVRNGRGFHAPETLSREEKWYTELLRLRSTRTIGIPTMVSMMALSNSAAVCWMWLVRLAQRP